MAAQTWQPHESLTQAPTNLKEAIDWVLRVTGRDGRKNEKAAQPPQFGCLCYLAKAVKDLLYDARSPGTPGPSSGRNWSDILLPGEQSIVKPVLTDLGLLSVGSTGAASSTCSGGTEVIKALIDQLAQGLQKWVGWQEGGQDACCLKGEGGNGQSTGIGKKCECRGGGGGVNCCGTGSAGTTCYDCSQCGPSGSGGTKCYQSAYCKPKDPPTGVSYWPTLSDKPVEVHLLARILLGSVCLIWSGLSQLGFLTKEGSGSGGNNERWKDSKLHEIKDDDSSGLGSFMAAMGYDLDRLNGSGTRGGSGGKTGADIWKLLSGQEPSDEKNRIKWQEFASVKGANQDSVAEYYSSIYGNAKTAVGKMAEGKRTEQVCEQYPLLVLHILASGYFRAGSAGANKVPVAPSAPSSDPKKDTTPRKPRTIREILYWLSALPYSEKYRELVERMDGKMKEKGNTIQLYNEKSENTDLKKCCIPYYLMAACGYCPLVLIGIQGTINTSGTDSNTGSTISGPAEKCPNNGKKKEEKTDCDKEKVLTKGGKVCYGGYHLAVKDFGPLHGMYANGLFGFQMDMSPAQCLDQLRIYVYHCFYQLYFLRKQCKVGVVAGDKAVLGWKSCRYGKDVYWGSGYNNSHLWRCKTEGNNNGKEHSQKCGISKGAGGTQGDMLSPLMCFLCDGVGSMACDRTRATSVKNYPEVEDHMNSYSPAHPKGHLKTPHEHCPIPMGWETPSSSGSSGKNENHFKDLKDTHKTAELSGAKGTDKYPAHCTGNTLSHLLEYYCDPGKCPSGTLVVLLRLLACITPTVPRTLGDLFGFYYYIVYIGGQSASGGEGVNKALGIYEKESKLHMASIGGNEVVEALTTWNNSGKCSGGTQDGTLKCLYKCDKGNGSQYLSPLSGQQYGQLSPVMAGTYLSWLVYLIGEFKGGLKSLEEAFKGIDCKNAECRNGAAGAAPGCGVNGQCRAGTHGGDRICCCDSVVSCTGVLPVLYKYGFGYGNVEALHKNSGAQKKCHDFLDTLNKVEASEQFKKLINEINQLIYTTRLPWIFVLTLAWLMAVLYLAFGAIWPLDWTHMRSHCRGWFRKGSLSPWEILMVGKKKGRGILEFFGGR